MTKFAAKILRSLKSRRNHIFSFIPQIQSLRGASKTQAAATAVCTWSSEFPRGHCTIGLHLTNLILSSCDLIAVIVHDCWHEAVESSKRLLSPTISLCCCWTLPVKPLNWRLSPSISVCCVWGLPLKSSIRSPSTSTFLCSRWLLLVKSLIWRLSSSISFWERLFGVFWWPASSKFNALIPLVTSSFCSGRRPF